MTDTERIEKLEQAIDSLLKVAHLQTASLSNISEAVKQLQEWHSSYAQKVGAN